MAKGGKVNHTETELKSLITWCKVNPKRESTDAYQRYENYKHARTVKESLGLGATWKDINCGVLGGVGKLRKDSAFRVSQGYAGTIAKATFGAAQANLDNGSALQPTIQPTSKNAPASNEGLELAQSNENDAHIAMERYVISVDDSKGRARLAQLKFLDGDGHNVVHAITPKDLRMGAWAKVYKGRYNEERNENLIACLYSHVKAWKRIHTDGDRGGMVFEDDIVQFRACSRNPACYCAGGVTFLAGAIKSFGSWKTSDSKQGVLETLLALSTLKQGGNDVPDYAPEPAGCLTVSPQSESLHATVMGSMAYVVPPDFAKRLIDAFRSTTTHRSPDVWLNHEKLIAQLYWPNPFGDNAEDSTIGTERKDRYIDLYMTSGYRKRASALGFPMPERGADEGAVLLWQLQTAQRFLRGGIEKQGFRKTAAEKG